ncbi:MAG TPA: VOC family protein, partial [Acidimicrobiales bacterium]|nr:VOC family protein [Acidimicrobiales bacterium]
ASGHTWGVPVTRMNHAVLYVRDVARSTAFYRDLLGFRVRTEIPGRAVFLTAPGSDNDHDLGLFQIGAGAGSSEAGRRTVGLYHLAWEVDTLEELARLRQGMLEAGALVGESDHTVSKSLYCQDPDGIEFELGWFVPPALWPEDAAAATKRLDLDAEIARYGARTPGQHAQPAPA